MKQRRRSTSKTPASFALLGFMMAVSASGHAEGLPQNPPVIPRLVGANPSTFDLNWAKQGLVVDVLAGDGPALPDPFRFDAEAKLGWSDEGLWARVVVKDATPWSAADLDRLYDGDGVELAVATRDTPKAMLQLVVSPPTDNVHLGGRQRIFDYRTREARQTRPAQGRARARKLADGYTVDLFMPWSNFEEHAPSGLLVRVTINNGTAAATHRVERLHLTTPGKPYDFFDLTPVVLGPAPAHWHALQAWGGYDDLSRTYVNVVATRAFAGHVIEVCEDAKPVATLRMRRQSSKAVAHVSLPSPLPGRTHGVVTVRMAGGATLPLPLPDLQKQREKVFASGARATSNHAPPVPWALPTFATHVFQETTFPAFAYPDPERIRRIAGDISIAQRFYNSRGDEVQRAHGDGRYGAAVTVTSSHAGSFTLYTTLFKGPPSNPGTDAVRAAAEFETKREMSEWQARKIDRDWWHSVRKRRGQATAYEYFVRTPKGYDSDVGKRWPALVFLHGTGGGDDMEQVRGSGPQKAAQSMPDWPFVTVSLRSPGGWYPPAVHDVIDEVMKAYRIDPDRLSLTGFSMGGMGTWEVALDRPERFAAIAPVGGRQGQPQHAERLKHTPIWVWNGALDTTTSPADAKRGVEALRGIGAQVRYTELPNAGHGESHDLAYSDPRLYTWFAEQRRRKAR